MRSAARWSSRSCASEIAAEHTSGRSKRHAGKQAAANHRRGTTADPDRAGYHRDGKLTGALSGKTLDVVSPIDGKTIAAIPDCETADVDHAVAGAGVRP
jgi:hypothetical protein